jgi:ATP-binding cassette subfamily F protein uup
MYSVQSRQVSELPKEFFRPLALIPPPVVSKSVAILLSSQNLSLSFGGKPLFDELNFSLSSGEKVGLIGPNGAGKSSLVKVLAGKIKPDEGNISQQKGLRIGYLEQTPKFEPEATVLSTSLEHTSDPHDWENMAKALELLGKLDFREEEGRGPETPVEALSGGWKKRVALARELMKQPDLLILDEPTNHLDVEGIYWLEEFLGSQPFATLIVTHDRFLLDIKGSYSNYLEVKETLMAGQLKTEDRLRNNLRRETEWLRRGAKARTTKQQARIDRTHELMETVAELGDRNKVQDLRLSLGGMDRNPKKLLEAKKITKSYDGRQIIAPLDLLISPKTRLGLLGRNGAGKSTLIRMLLGDEKPDGGEIIRSDQLQTVYFEQNRESLDPEKTLLKTVCPSGDHVDFGGKLIHVRAYLDRFLFSPGQYELPVGKLSGGEQSRILLAKLMVRKANFLVLDEPTNDLDIPTLNVLEEMLKEFNGAVVLVSHDRYFLSSVTNEILAIEDGGTERFVDLFQWEEWKKSTAGKKKPKEKAKPAAATPAAEKKKLSFKEQQELDKMEATIHAAEEKVKSLEAETQGATPSRLKEITTELAKAQSEVERLYVRWEELGARA